MVFTRDAKRHMFAGGVTGCCAKLAITPLDRAHILLKLQHPYYRMCRENGNVFKFMYQVCQKEGPRSLWKGTTMVMIRAFPYSAVQFYAVDKCVYKLDRVYGKRNINAFVAGAVGSVTAVLTTYPLDLMQAKLAYQLTGKKEPRYKGIVHGRKTIYAEGGVRAFYRGITPTLIGVIPYGGFSFFAFHNVKDYLLKRYPNEAGASWAAPNPKDVQVLKVWLNIVNGGFAGAVSQTVTFPLDRARRKAQLSNVVLNNNSAWKQVFSTMSEIYKKDGVAKGLYRGLSINYIRVIPQQAIAYTVYEQLRQFFGLNKKDK